MAEEKKVVYRDSKDGQFITRKEAVRRPATTERQHVPVHPPKQSNKKK